MSDSPGWQDGDSAPRREDIADIRSGLGETAATLRQLARYLDRLFTLLPTPTDEELEELARLPPGTQLPEALELALHRDDLVDALHQRAWQLERLAAGRPAVLEEGEAHPGLGWPAEVVGGEPGDGDPSP